MPYKIVIIVMLLCMGGCGIKGELVRPSDIPEYKKEQQDQRGSLPL